MHRAPPADALEVGQVARQALLAVDRTGSGRRRGRVGVLGAKIDPECLAARACRRVSGQRAIGLERRQRAAEADPGDHAVARRIGTGRPVELHDDGLGSAVRSIATESRRPATGERPTWGACRVRHLDGGRPIDPGGLRRRQLDGHDGRLAAARNDARGRPFPRQRAEPGGRRLDAGELDPVRRELHPREDALGQEDRLALAAADQHHVADATTAGPVREDARIHRAEVFGVGRDRVAGDRLGGRGAGPAVEVVPQPVPPAQHQRRDDQEQWQPQSHLGYPQGRPEPAPPRHSFLYARRQSSIVRIHDYHA